MSSIYIWTKGDRSVGIRPGKAKLETDFRDFEDFDEETREDIKNRLGKLIEDMYDDVIDVIYFDDECPNCGDRLNKKGICRKCEAYTHR